jgi:signal transduction histidine kinase
MNWQRVGILTILGILGFLGLIGLLGTVPVRLLSGLLIASTLLTVWILTRPVSWRQRSTNQPSLEERQQAALSLRATRERERAFYEITTTLSSTLDYQKVLDAVQDIGKVILREHSNGARLVSAALLFQEGRRDLRVASARGLTRSDMAVIVPGEQGVVGLALKQAEPVFASLPKHDPELRYFAAFVDCGSMLAVPLVAGYQHYGVLLFGSPQENAFSQDSIELLKAIGTQATIALQNATLYQRMMEEKERIVEVDEDARKKLARDLHDGPTQSIAAIAMRINYVRRLVQTHAEAFGELGKIEDLARRTTKEIRHMLFTLRPLILETQGLVAALDQLAEKMSETHDQNVIVEAQQGIERWIDHNTQGILFYIIEEAVNNARKHAEASHIWVRLKQQEGYFIAEVEDDGVGFNQAAVQASIIGNHLGMTNMQERTELIEGILHIDSKEGMGTKVSVLIPLSERDMADTREVPAASSKPKKPSRLQQVTQGGHTVEEPVRVATPVFTTPQPHERPTRPAIPHADKRSPSS